MYIGEAWIGEITTISGEDNITVDAAKLFRYLLLFDRVIIKSYRLREFNVLAGVLGLPGLFALLRSGTIRVLCHTLTMAQTGQSSIGGRTTPLPYGSYSFRAVTQADRRYFLHRCFQNVKPGHNLTYKEAKRLKREIASRLVEPIDAVQQEMDNQFLSELRCSAPHFCTALSLELRRNYGISLKPSNLRLNINEISERDFRVESNLNFLPMLDEIDCHKAIGRALLAVSGLNRRLAEMNAYQAITDLWYRDLPVLGGKLRFLSDCIAPERQDRALATVLALPGLPDIAEEISQGRVNFERFMEIRNSPDGLEFRRWFRSRGPDDITLLSKQWRNQWQKLRNKLGVSVCTPGGRTVRWIVSNAAGLFPPLGIAASAIDSFVLEKLFPQTQPLTFLQHSYRSIFDGHDDDNSQLLE